MNNELGTVSNPHEVGEEYIVNFKYDNHNYFQVQLEKDGSLSIRASGLDSDTISINCSVSNQCFIVPLRYNLKKRMGEQLRSVE